MTRPTARRGSSTGPRRIGPLILFRSFLPVLVTALAWRALVAQDAGPAGIAFSSPAFGDGGTIPDIYTCVGQDISPPLAWGELPAGTRSLALVVDDPDAPDPEAPKMTWVHWVIYNIPVSATGLPEGVSSLNLPVGAIQGLNDWKHARYGGPCPPTGEHRYFYKLYALDTVFADLGTPTKATLEKAMEGHVVGQAQMVGTYERP